MSDLVIATAELRRQRDQLARSQGEHQETELGGAESAGEEREKCHDDFGRHVYPASLWHELAARLGQPALQPEVFGPQTAASLLQLRAQMLASLDQAATVCEYLLDRDQFDLFAVVLGAVHRGGHYLWDLSQIDTRDLPPDERRQLAEGNHDLYRAADAAVGRILAKAPASSRVMVFALHGMGQNAGWTEHFPQLVNQIHRGGAAGPVKTGLLYRAKRALPWELVREVTTRLPTRVNMKLLSMWSARMYDWSTTRFFPLPVDYSGFVRLNVREREAQGVVAPGNEFGDVVADVVEGLQSFGDLETGEPITSAVQPIEDLVGQHASRRQVLPDVVVRWSDRPATASIGVRSSKHGELRWERHARFQSGRSGNHLPFGWMIASGPGINSGVDCGCHETVDLTPTILSWLGLPPPDRFVGSAIRGFLRRPTA